jgi:hypothetical protein
LNFVGVEPALGEAWVERFATLLGRSGGVRVTTKGDIAQLLGMERQRQLLGCSDGTGACIAELVGGLGMEAVLSGSIAKSGTRYTVTLRTIRVADGAEVASTSERFDDERALEAFLDEEAARLARKIELAFGRRAPEAAGHPERWVPAIAGGVVLLTGAGLELAARLDVGTLTSGAVPIAEQPAVISRGKTLETAGWVMVGVGAAAVAASVVWAVAADSGTPRVAVVPLQGGALLSFGGGLP